MPIDSSGNASLRILKEIAAGLGAQIGRKYLARQLLRAAALAEALAARQGMEILAVNPSLGKPWNIEVLRACGCQVTVLEENRKLLDRIRKEHVDLPVRHKEIPDLADFLASTAESGDIEFVSGQVSLFFPEEDSFDAACLFMLAKDFGGFGPEPVLMHCLRGLKEGGHLLAGFLNPAFRDPAAIRNAAANSEFDLDPPEPMQIEYDEFAPAGLLFTLREKHGRSVGLEVFEQITAGLQAQRRGNLSRKIEEAIQLARLLEIEKGANILVVRPTPELWSERVMAALAGQIHVVLETDLDLDEVKSEFSLFPGIAAIEGGLKLQKALRNPNIQIYHTGFLKALCELKAYDLICLTARNGDFDALRICLDGLKPQGRLLLGCHHEGQCDPEAVESLTASRGHPLTFIRKLSYGSLHGELFG